MGDFASESLPLIQTKLHRPSVPVDLVPHTAKSLILSLRGASIRSLDAGDVAILFMPLRGSVKHPFLYILFWMPDVEASVLMHLLFRCRIRFTHAVFACQMPHPFSQAVLFTAQVHCHAFCE